MGGMFSDDGFFSGSYIESQINKIEDGEATVAALSEAIRLADEAQDYYYSLRFRDRIINELSSIDRVKIFPYVSEFEQIFEEHPGVAGSKGVDDLLGNLIYAIECISDIPEIPRDQWAHLTESLLEKVKAYRWGMQGYWYVMAIFYEKTDLPRAVECARKMLDCQRDVTYPYIGKANAVAARIFLAAGDRFAADAQAEECERIGTRRARGNCYSGYIEHLLPARRLDEADALADKLYQITESPANIVNAWCYTCLEFACNLMVEQYERMETENDKDVKYKFYRAAWATCRQLAKHHDSAFLEFPETFSLYNSDDLYDPTELGNYFYGKAAELAAVFDARNGSDWYAQNLANACACEILPEAQEAAERADVRTGGCE